MLSVYLDFQPIPQLGVFDPRQCLTFLYDCFPALNATASGNWASLYSFDQLLFSYAEHGA